MPRLPRLLAVSVSALGVALVSAAPASAVGYSVAISAPSTGDIVSRVVVVEADATGAVTDAVFAAYQVLPDGASWNDSARVMMRHAGEGRFEASANPWLSDDYLNAEYRVEVRIWGDVPTYDPSNPDTFALGVSSVTVDNAPPVPSGLGKVDGVKAVRVTWSEVAGADRGDFIGYQLYRAPGGSSCPAISSYRPVGMTSSTWAVETKLAPGAYCYRVSAVRSSAARGSIASAPSAPVRAVAKAPSASTGDGTGGDDPGVGDDPDATTGGTTPTSFFRRAVDAPIPPRPPALDGGLVEGLGSDAGNGTSGAGEGDGTYDDQLPYGSRKVRAAPPGAGAGAAAPVGSIRELGESTARTTAVSVAGGLVLAIGALLLRRFLYVGDL